MIWNRTHSGYDQKRTGLEIEEFEEASEGVNSTDRRTYFDTTQVGKSNDGHDFPNELTKDERSAVTEYLKT